MCFRGSDDSDTHSHIFGGAWAPTKPVDVLCVVKQLVPKHLKPSAMGHAFPSHNQKERFTAAAYQVLAGPARTGHI